MKSFCYYLISVSFCLLVSVGHAEPTSLYQKKQELNEYVSSGSYQKELSQKANQGKELLNNAIKENKAQKKPKKLAVVFDIDETVLSNYPALKKAKYCGSIRYIEHQIEKAEASAIAPMKELYQQALENHVTVFFVTGRPLKLKTATIKNLNQEGFNQYKKVYFNRKKYKHDETVSHYKTEMRKAIEKQGYDIVLNVGDQQSDLEGGEAANTVKLPNPFYYIP